LELGQLTYEMRMLFAQAGWEAAFAYLDSALAEFALFGAPPEVEAARPRIERIAQLHARGYRFVLYGRAPSP
jgi:hypothetical protein